MTEESPKEISFGQSMSSANNKNRNPAGVAETIQSLVFWPTDELKCKSKRKQNKSTINAPSVLTGTKWQEVQEKKQNDMKRKAEEKLIKQTVKKEKIEKAKIEKQEAKARREAQNLEKEKIRLEKERQKMLKQQQKLLQLETRNKEKGTLLARAKEIEILKKRLSELGEKPA